MKSKISLLSVLMLFGIFALAAETKTTEFKVYGNCGMCKTRIEKAVNAIDGVSTSEWNKETKMLELTFEESKTDVKAIQKAIAEVGHDTEFFTAKTEVYNELPDCCKYDRKIESSMKKECNDMANKKCCDSKMPSKEKDCDSKKK